MRMNRLLNKNRLYELQKEPEWIPSRFYSIQKHNDAEAQQKSTTSVGLGLHLLGRCLLFFIHFHRTRPFRGGWPRNLGQE